MMVPGKGRRLAASIEDLSHHGEGINHGIHDCAIWKVVADG